MAAEKAGSARLCRPEAYTTTASAFFLALKRLAPEAEPEKFARPELWKVELEFESADWKTALLDGGTDALLEGGPRPCRFWEHREIPNSRGGLCPPL